MCLFTVDNEDARKNEAAIFLIVFTFVCLTLEKMKSPYLNRFCVCLTFVCAIAIIFFFLFSFSPNLAWW